MSRIKITLIIFLLFFFFNIPSKAMQFVVGSMAYIPTDYTQHPNCIGAWYFNSSNVEIDRSGNGNSLTESAGDDIPAISQYPSGFSSNDKSRNFTFSDQEWLYNSDEDELDLHGADQQASFHARFKIGYVENGKSYAIMGKRGSAPNFQYGIYIRGYSATTFCMRFYISHDGTNYDYVESTITNYSVGKWYSLGCSSNDVDLRIYVDGILDCTPVAHMTGIADGSADFTVGEILATNFTSLIIEEGIIFNIGMNPSDFMNMHKYGIDGNKGAND